MNTSQKLHKILMQEKMLETIKIKAPLKSDLRDILREYSELIGDIKIEIDGREAEILSIAGYMAGAEITEGLHEITIKLP